GMATYWRHYNGTAISFTLTEGPKWAAGVSRITGAHTSTPINVDAGSSSGTSSTSVVAPSISTNVNNTLVLAFFTNKKNSTYTPPGGTTERYDVPNNSDGLPSNMMASYIQASM